MIPIGQGSHIPLDASSILGAQQNVTPPDASRNPAAPAPGATSGLGKRRKMPPMQLGLLNQLRESANQQTFLMPSSLSELAQNGLSKHVPATQEVAHVGDADAPSKNYSKLLSMDKAFLGEEKGIVFNNNVKVQYLTPEQCNELKVTFKDGKIHDAKGQVLDTQNIASEVHQDNRRGIFVMDKSGNIYISKFKAKGFFQHSSFMAGKSVAAAGYIDIENGVVKAISRKSGHYKPGLENLEQLMKELNLNNTQVHRDFKVDDTIE